MSVEKQVIELPVEHVVDHVVVRLEPYQYQHGACKIRCSVMVDGEEHHWEYWLPRNELLSRYDLLMRRAVAELRKSLLGE
ncbi:hypothetical protein LCGC14_1905200 [marine sediment metagenome]|uniref:Uncharacterized protein n=1 Tax=marine sediment metagenome TaxID=412755 RepID=A0A0F9GIQ1_9ZZZZ